MATTPEDSVIIGLGERAARAAADGGCVAVVIDALRASSTIATALHNGAKSVRVVRSIEDCVGEITIGERDGQKLPGMDYGNSPTELINANLQGKEVVLTSTNGARCVDVLAKSDVPLVIASIINAPAAAAEAIRIAKLQGRKVAVVLAGRRGRLEDDDRVAGEVFVRHLMGKSIGLDDVLSKRFANSPAAGRLRKLGYGPDVAHCQREGWTDTVPILQGDCFVASGRDNHD